MKKVIMIGGGVIVLVIVVSWWASLKAKFFMQKGEVLENLTYEVSAFYREDNRLPANWEEFVVWSEKTHSPVHWTVEVLNSRFALKWSARVVPSDPQNEKLFLVLDPDFKDIEYPANVRLRDWCLMSETSGDH